MTDTDNEVPRSAFVTIGEITKTRGVKGEVKVVPVTDCPERLCDLDSVYVETKDGTVQIAQIERVRLHSGFASFKFRGIESPEGAEKLRGSFIMVKREDVFPLKEGKFYVFQLLGLDVQTEDGTSVGTVHDVINSPANDVYVVRNGQREYLIPAVRQIVKDIDLQRGKITIDAIDGLLD